MPIALFNRYSRWPEAVTACLDHAGRGRTSRHVFLGDYVGCGALKKPWSESIKDRVSAVGLQNAGQTLGCQPPRKRAIQYSASPEGTGSPNCRGDDTAVIPSERNPL
jgi:hypothetical protein